MKATMIKTAAVAGLFLLGAATLRAQAPAAYSNHRARDTAKATLPVINGVIQGIAAEPKAENRKRKQEVVSEWRKSIDYSGPRFGFTYLPKAIVDSLAGRNIDVDPAITQFGWQLEHEVHVTADGPMVLNEWVFLAGGLEKGVFLPSVTWLIGARGQSGNEIGFGPNVSIAGVGLAVAGGVTVNTGGLHVPMNIAAASSKGGIRVSFLTGFSLH